MRRGSQRRHPLEAGQARDAIGPFGFERRRRWIMLVAAEIGPGMKVAAMAVLDGGCRDGRERCRGARGRTAGQEELVSVSANPAGALRINNLRNLRGSLGVRVWRREIYQGRM